MQLKEVLDEFSKTNPNKVILFIGSGLVKSLGYPSWLEFLEKGIDFTKKYSEEASAMMNARIKKKHFIDAGNSFFEPEIHVTDFHTFLREQFEKTPSIPINLLNLFSCPVAAFITTNFDETIEQSLVQRKKKPEAYADQTRFRKFSSRLSVFADSIESRTKNGLVLKMHGDIRYPEEIVLSNSQFSELRLDKSYDFLYKRLLSQYKILFLGFSGNDPNFESHCKTLFEVCGQPIQSSYLVHPESDPPTEIIQQANIIPIPFSEENNFLELDDFMNRFAKAYAYPITITSTTTQLEEIDESKNILAFICAGLSESMHTSSYQCAIVSIVAEAAKTAGGLDNERNVIEVIARTYHVSMQDARCILQQADHSSVVRTIEKREVSKTRFEHLLRTLKDGIKKRSRAFGKSFQKTESTIDKIVVEVLISSLAKAGSGLALSLMDSEEPEASMVNKVTP